MDDDDDSSKT
jgi:hypothetical protein